MQIGEKATASTIADDHDDHDEDCYFCNARKDEPKEEVNELTQDPIRDEDVDDDTFIPNYIAYKKDASKLRVALVNDGQPQKTAEAKVTIDGKPHDVGVAAHHLIPGVSLQESALFEGEWLWKDGEAKGNIGYNINAAPNGVWLPGNYAIRPWRSGRSTEFKDEYASAAIEATGAQFHDAHTNYNEFMRGVLDKIAFKLENTRSIVCPKAKKEAEKKPEERHPLYALVLRLNTVSARMKRMLVASTESLRLHNWRHNIFTSTRSEAYIEMLMKKHNIIPKE
jgi:hypothetical protein